MADRPCSPNLGASDDQGGDFAMAQSGMRTSTDVMLQTSNDVNGVADSLTAELTGLMDRLAPLYTSWQGAGGTTFQTVRASVEEEMGRLNVALRSIAEAVRTAGTDYSVTDDEMRADLEAAGAP